MSINMATSYIYRNVENSYFFQTRGFTHMNALNAVFALFKGMTFYCFGTYVE